MTDTSSDQDRAQGAMDKIKGKVKETVGDIGGDNSTKVGGKVDSLKGEGRDKLADAKDRISGNQSDETR